MLFQNAAASVLALIAGKGRIAVCFFHADCRRGLIFVSLFQRGSRPIANQLCIMQGKGIANISFQHDFIKMQRTLQVFILNAAKRHQVIGINEIRVIVNGFFQLNNG